MLTVLSLLFGSGDADGKASRTDLSAGPDPQQRESASAFHWHPLQQASDEETSVTSARSPGHQSLMLKNVCCLLSTCLLF